MIIDDFNIICIAVMPSKTNTPLLIYSDTVLARAISFQWFNSVSWWNPQITYILSVVNHPQFPPRNSLNIFR